MSALQSRVSTRARQVNSPAIVAATNSHDMETTWSTLPQDPAVRSSPPPDTDELMVSRSNSVSNLEETTSQAENRVNGTERSATRKDKGKGKEKEKGVENGNPAEEPLAITYNLNEFGPPQVRSSVIPSLVVVVEDLSTRQTKTIAHPANLLALWSTAMVALERSIFGASIHLWSRKTSRKETSAGFVQRVRCNG